MTITERVVRDLVSQTVTSEQKNDVISNLLETQQDNRKELRKAVRTIMSCVRQASMMLKQPTTPNETVAWFLVRNICDYKQHLTQIAEQEATINCIADVLAADTSSAKGAEE